MIIAVIWTQFKQLRVEAWKRPLHVIVEAWSLKKASTHNCLNCVHNCDDHSLLDFKICSYMEHFIYHFANICIFWKQDHREGWHAERKRWKVGNCLFSMIFVLITMWHKMFTDRYINTFNCSTSYPRPSKLYPRPSTFYSRPSIFYFRQATLGKKIHSLLLPECRFLSRVEGKF